MIPITETADDTCFMMQAVDLARRHRDPCRNKAIAALIVREGLVIGHGVRSTRRQKATGLIETCHAEEAAIKEAGARAQGATLYVTLAPCAERANAKWDVPKPPCCELVAQAHLARVVIGAFDEDFGGGGGVKYLLQRGICVEHYPLDAAIIKLLLGEERGRPKEKPDDSVV